MPRQYTYGPFKSRRLGLSLGVDILPNYKLCTYNCVYCEIGPTHQVVSPEHRVKLPPTTQYRKELKDILKYVPHLDSITFGYNGEPTLNENLLDFLHITKEVRKELDWDHIGPQITLFTNSSTLYIRKIRERVKNFELVLAKLDAGLNNDFLHTNRPHHDCPDAKAIINSLKELRKLMTSNKLALQILIYNSNKDDFKSNNNYENIEHLAQAVKLIEPDIIQIYSIARIPSEYFIYSISEDRKKEIVKIFKKIINNDFIEINHY
jgi:wyosine [tRNA(Phe)-imidazoG37] synthetase (radical SAM superfamily)